MSVKGKSGKNYKYLRIIGIILFIYILSRINLQELFQTLKNINLSYFLLAIILLPVSPILAILKWRMLINSQDLKIPFRRLTEFFFKGLFLGTITPGRLGEFWKAKYLTDNFSISGGRAFYTVLMERLIDLIIIVTVGLVGLITFFLSEKIGFLLFLILPLIILAIYPLIKVFISLLKRKKTNPFFKGFLSSLAELNFFTFLKLSCYGILYYLTTIFIYYFLALSLGINIGFLYLFLIVALVFLVLILPITILGLGTREASYIFLFSIFSITASTAVAFSSLILLVGIVLSIPGVILFLKK